MHQPVHRADGGGGKNAEQNRRAHLPRLQRRDHQDAEDRERHIRIAQVPHRDNSRRIRLHDARVPQADKCDEEADPRADRRVQLRGDRRDDPLPHAHHGKNQKRHARKKHRAQRCLPRHTHPLHHRVGEIRVQPHAGRERNRVARKRSHQNGAERRRQAGGRKHRRNGHARVLENGGIDEHDVGHRDERSDPRQDFRLPGRVQLLEFEVALQRRQGSSRHSPLYACLA